MSGYKEKGRGGGIEGEREGGGVEGEEGEWKGGEGSFGVV